MGWYRKAQQEQDEDILFDSVSSVMSEPPPPPKPSQEDIDRAYQDRIDEIDEAAFPTALKDGPFEIDSFRPARRGKKDGERDWFWIPHSTSYGGGQICYNHQSNKPVWCLRRKHT